MISDTNTEPKIEDDQQESVAPTQVPTPTPAPTASPSPVPSPVPAMDNLNIPSPSPPVVKPKSVSPILGAPAQTYHQQQQQNFNAQPSPPHFPPTQVHPYPPSDRSLKIDTMCIFL